MAKNNDTELVVLKNTMKAGKVLTQHICVSNETFLGKRESGSTKQ